jgi:protein-S-isoprenylcysteine O-methyltransferase Ste14
MKAIIGSYIGVLAFALLIYIAGGKVVYWQATLYVVVAITGTTLNHVLLPKGSDLTIERASRVKEGVKWDRILLGVLFLLTIATFILAGLDSGRYNWSGQVPVTATVAGVLLMIAGQILFALAKRANSFFSSTVRIETKRKHRVCENGPYRLIRHPGYLGMIISLAGFPLVLNSYWSFIPVVVSIGILALRAYLEDNFLKEQLEGYSSYAVKTRCRLIPGLF